MKLRAVTLENVRRFTTPARIDGIGDGLNVLCEPNEHGKSTLFDAIQALFFKAHGSRDREVKELQPHAGGAPQVSVEVETEQGLHRITKRWLSKPLAEVTRDGRLIAQADEAEDWIAGLLSGGQSGPAGLVWVRQGMTHLTAGAKKDQEQALEARRDLMSSVTGEVEAMTGGRRMDMALTRCTEELATYATATGRPRAGGPWKAAQERVEELTAARDQLSETARALHDALRSRNRSRRELSELEEPSEVQARQDRLAEAQQAFDAAQGHARKVEEQERAVAAARLARDHAVSRRDALQGALAEQQAAQKAVTEADAAAAAASDATEGAEEKRKQATEDLERAKAARQSAAEVLQRARHAQAARDGAARRKELLSRIEQAEAARKNLETARAAARHGPDAQTLRRLEDLAQALATARATRDAAAAQLVMRYEDGAAQVTLDGAPLPDGTSVAAPHGGRLALPGLGTLDLRPGPGGAGEAEVEQAQRALAAALEKLGLPDLAAARTAAEARQAAEAEAREAASLLDAHAPDGIDPLREALAQIPQPQEETDDLPPLPEAEAALSTADATLAEAQSAQATASDGLSEARSRSASTQAALQAAQDRLARAKQALEKLGDTTAEALATEVAQAETALTQASGTLATLREQAPDLASAEAHLKRAKSAEENARSAIARLRPEIAALDERIRQGAGEAVEERLAETEQELTAAQADLDRIEHEVALLNRLKEALESARASARESYFAPIAAELKPLLQLLWPEAELTWEDAALLPEALVRDGQEEPIRILSGGTQEQVALLTRLAFARMLARDGRHAPVILDDALVFTDDDRIERMFDALHRQAGDLQILVLTCRQRAFRDLGGRALRLESVEG
ncbi:AAA family ATPase [Allosediminivita pacifica]|uniref:DNA repair exonuclease SbcCD ATPase subunit n=1 Tax=Allosediminivita pacifica TaxID=1267769 RepID=A0A2T6AW75_9RHOB|nr:AAA family ATPase [Allosediminivita pacifica]PTX48071.1 DNA repair exonuclease SbcCD ATPase subunit [Allosediminivita pacifica]GGB11993.1 GTP-binding protein [Allosediminivita pacifica]